MSTSDIPDQLASMMEVDNTKPTVISITQSYDHTKKEYKVQLQAMQDDLTIEDTDEITFYDFMSAKIYIDKFYERFAHATH